MCSSPDQRITLLMILRFDDGWFSSLNRNSLAEQEIDLKFRMAGDSTAERLLCRLSLTAFSSITTTCCVHGHAPSVVDALPDEH
jgi:hypothetical protein